MSEIRHELSATWGDCRNSSADENAYAVKPNDRTKLLRAARIISSSSTIEITPELVLLVCIRTGHGRTVREFVATRLHSNAATAKVMHNHCPRKGVALASGGRND